MKTRRDQWGEGRATAVVDRAFWGDPTIAALPPVAKMLALYLITGPGGRSSGIFPCVVPTVAGLTRLKEGQVEESIQLLEKADFLQRDQTLVWVRQMAAYQIGADLAGGDTRIIMAVEQVLHYKKSPLSGAFLDHYSHKWPGLHDFLEGRGKLFSRGREKRLLIAEAARKILDDWRDNGPSKCPLTMPHTMGHTMPVNHLTEPTDLPDSKNKKISLASDNADATRQPPTGARGTPSDPVVRASESPRVGSQGEQPSPPPPQPGAADRLLQRLQGDAQKQTSSCVVYTRDPGGAKKGAAMFTMSASAIDAPWTIPQGWTKLDALFQATILQRQKPYPPLLKQGEDLLEQLKRAWKGVHERRIGPWRGRMSKTPSESIQGGANILRLKLLSPWTYFDWVFLDYTHKKHPPRFRTVASETHVARTWEEAKRDRKILSSPYETEAHNKVYRAKLEARAILIRQRPTTEADALDLIKGVLNTNIVVAAQKAAKTETDRLLLRDKRALEKGVWIWRS